MSFYEDKIFPYFMEKATKTFRREIAELIAQGTHRCVSGKLCLAHGSQLISR